MVVDVVVPGMVVDVVVELPGMVVEVVPGVVVVVAPPPSSVRSRTRTRI
jgi:hypothetical protein